MTLPIQRCLDNLIKKIQHGASDVLIENWSTTDMLRDSIDMVFKQRSDFGYPKDPSGTTHRISRTISSWQNG